MSKIGDLYLEVQRAHWNPCDNISSDVVKFWKLVPMAAHPYQWLTDLGGPDQISHTALPMNILQMKYKDQILIEDRIPFEVLNLGGPTGPVESISR